MSPGMTPESDRRRKGGFALVGTIGGYVALCILVGLGLGLLLDSFLHTTPLFLIAGVVIGFVVSFFLIYRLAMRELVE